MTERRDGRGFGGTVKAGKRGEQTIAFHYNGMLMPRAHPWDVECYVVQLPDDVRLVNSRGALRVEVKTDAHEPVNAYIERWTVKPDGTKRAGGPWRAYEDGADAYCYYFPFDGTVLWFWNLGELCARLDAAVTSETCTWRKLRIDNPDGRCALGRLVPLEDLAGMAVPYYARDRI